MGTQSGHKPGRLQRLVPVAIGVPDDSIRALVGIRMRPGFAADTFLYFRTLSYGETRPGALFLKVHMDKVGDGVEVPATLYRIPKIPPSDLGLGNLPGVNDEAREKMRSFLNSVEREE